MYNKKLVYILMKLSKEEKDVILDYLDIRTKMEVREQLHKTINKI